MQIISTIKSFSHFKDIVDYTDGVILKNKDFSSYGDTLCYEEMIDVIKYANKHNKKVFLDISVMLYDELLSDVEKYILNTKDYDVYYVYFDIGLYNILKKYNVESSGIYDPKTLITNSLDFNLYSTLNMHALGVSLEIPLCDVLKINEVKESRIWYRVFGYHQMFYSARHLISTYSKFSKTSIELNDNLYLKEETRDDKYPIVQNNHGTTIFRPYVINMIKEANNIKNLDYIYLDSYKITEEVYNKILKLYYDVLYKNTDPIFADSLIKELVYTEDGFIYEDSVYVKAEVKR